MNLKRTQWNGILRYALYIGLDDDGVIVPFDCTAEEWRLTSDTDYVWNVTYRFIVASMHTH